MTRAKAQTNDQAIKVNLDEIERAVMREMEKTLQKSNPEYEPLPRCPTPVHPYGTIWCSIGATRNRAEHASSA
ncbi:hypothetical protein AA309_28395 [Microvirga vignae]|uniref:Uncharacterized protein n=1 Tax=Microvirga vignae TaxID=1225564 RepID=A0A0H1R576_9HYPH|nr:hypothetical protein [Microvirga vignae]KLK89971.1 hypothetical protein AA309_28395 [Microvirga vignae]